MSDLSIVNDSGVSEALTKNGMRGSIIEILGHKADGFDDCDNLIYCGLDSIRIMRLANIWNIAGANVKFVELIAEPTLAAWWALICSKKVQAVVVNHLVAVEKYAPFDLAPMQQAYWLGANGGEISDAVNAHYYIEVDAPSIDPLLLQKAVNSLIGRHDMLRACFLRDGRQFVSPHTSWKGITLHQLDNLPEKIAAKKLDEIRFILSNRRMDTEAGEVFDVQLSILPGGVCRLHINVEMLVCDAQSFQIILAELAHLYAQPNRPLPPINCSFQEYLATSSVQQAKRKDEARAYWLEKLPQLPGRPQLPLISNPSNLQNQNIGRRYHWIDAQGFSELEHKCRDRGLTISTVLATLFAEVVGAWSEEPRFLINMPLFERKELHPDVNKIVGDFTNLTIFSADVSGDLSISDRAKQFQLQLAADISHSEYSGLEVLRDLMRARESGILLAPVVFTSVIGMGELFDTEFRRTFGKPCWTISQTPQVWLDCQVIEDAEGLLINWDVVENVFAQGVIDAMFGAYVDVIKTLAKNTSAWDTNGLCLLPNEQKKCRDLVNQKKQLNPIQCLHHKFFSNANIFPDRVALAWGEKDFLSYGGLAERAMLIASLLRKHDVLIGDAVAVTMTRSADQVAAVLGILFAGAVYVPVGIDQPVARREKIYESANVRIVLTRELDAHVVRCPTNSFVAVSIEDASACEKISCPSEIDADQLAYVIFTSGSTGTPKGVEITHRSAVNTIEDINERFGVIAEDRVLGVSSLEFDLSVYDIFGMLSVGGAVVIVEHSKKTDAREWIKLINQWSVSIWNSVPALLDMLLSFTEHEKYELGLRLALVSGDWISLDLPERFKTYAKQGEFVSLGGATEGSIWSNFFKVEKIEDNWISIPYGYPLTNQKFRVVDNRGRDCPDWVPGELWIGGLGVANGYRNQQQMTAERFVHVDGDRWYRTGDRGRYRSDGCLEFLGRIDSQVKINGHRIELGEIESTILRYPHISRAVVMVSQYTSKLTAAIIYDDNSLVFEEKRLKIFISQELPAYMIPENIVLVESLPLTENGKVNYKALAKVILDQPQIIDSDEGPATEIENRLMKLWVDILGHDKDVTRSTNFFLLGGNSILAIRLLDTIRRQFGVEIKLMQLMVNQNIRELAALIESADIEIEEGVI